MEGVVEFVKWVWQLGFAIGRSSQLSCCTSEWEFLSSQGRRSWIAFKIQDELGTGGEFVGGSRMSKFVDNQRLLGSLLMSVRVV